MTTDAGLNFNPIFLDSQQTCGICKHGIEPNSIAHGHIWSIEEQNSDKIGDVFHRICIEDHITHGNHFCPNCNTLISNAHVYNRETTSGRLLDIQVNKTHFQALKHRKAYAEIEPLLKSTSIGVYFHGELVKAAKEGDVLLMQALLASSPRTDEEDLDAMLWVAASRGFDSIIKIILEHRRQLGFVKGECGITIAMGYALEGGHFDAANLLLDESESFSDKFYQSLLYKSYRYGYSRGAAVALERPGVLKQPSNGLDLAFYASAAENCTEMIDYLFREGAAISGQAFIQAIQSGIQKKQSQEAMLLIIEHIGCLPAAIKEQLIDLARTYNEDVIGQALEGIPTTETLEQADQQSG